MNARILYWGIAGAGKTTNLETIRAKLRADHRGELRREPTRLDPTVTYETLPIQLGEVGGVPMCIEVVAVPDGDEQAPTRKQLLDEVSGVVLVVDSTPSRMQQNVESRDELAAALESYGRSLAELPVLVQYNKRDLADDTHIERLHRRIALPSAAVFEAVATEGTGVLQTLTTISKRVVRGLRDRPAAASEPAPAPESTEGTADAAPAHETAHAPAEPAPVGRPAPVYDPDALLRRARPEAPALSTTELLEQAIEAEAIAADAGAAAHDALDLETHRAFDRPYDALASEPKPPSGFALGADLRIVSVGSAARAGERAVRIPLVLGDASGATASLALTIQLDPLLDGGDE